MYKIVLHNGHFGIFKDGIKKPIFFGFGDITIALAVARVNCIDLTFENTEIRNAA